MTAANLRLTAPGFEDLYVPELVLLIDTEAPVVFVPDHKAFLQGAISAITLHEKFKSERVRTTSAEQGIVGNIRTVLSYVRVMLTTCYFQSASEQTGRLGEVSCCDAIPILKELVCFVLRVEFHVQHRLNVFDELVVKERRHILDVNGCGFQVSGRAPADNPPADSSRKDCDDNRHKQLLDETLNRVEHIRESTSYPRKLKSVLSNCPEQGNKNKDENSVEHCPANAPGTSQEITGVHWGEYSTRLR